MLISLSNILRMVGLKHLFCCFFLLIFSFCQGQVTELTGGILIGNSEMMSYKVVYEIKTNNIISGYSISDLNGSGETRAIITGQYDPKKKLLRFEEKKISSSKAKLPPDEFCLMKVEGSFSKKNGKSLFSGTFVSSSPNNKIICQSGSVLLTPSRDLEKALNKVEKQKKKAEPQTKPENALLESLAPISGVSKIKSLEAGSLTEYPLLSDTIRLDILDDKLEDGDKISIYQNKTKVVSELTTTNKVHNLMFLADKNDPVVVFTIIACNEGFSPPNTIKVVLSNGSQKELLIALLKKDQMVKIVLKR